MLEIKNTVTEMQNAFDRLISRLDMAEEGIGELESWLRGTSQTQIRRERKEE